MKLLLTRHGQSRWQTEGDSAGEDAVLSPLGELQAHRLGKYLRRYDAVDRVVASPLQRAHQTATIVASYLDLPVSVDSDLREFESWDAGIAPNPRSPWEPEPEGALHPEHVEFGARVRAALQRAIGDETRDETVLVVAHGGTVGMALRLLSGTTTLHIWSSNTALHGLRWKGDFWLLRYVNFLEHLPRTMRTW